MTAATLARTLGTSSVVLTAAAGWAWNDCLLLATSAVLGYRLFLLHMDRGAPWSALSAALNALAAGLLVVVAGSALMAGVLAAWLGWWQLAPLSSLSSSLSSPLAWLVWLVPTIAAAGCCLAHQTRAGAAEELRLWLFMLAGLLLATNAYTSGWALAPCLFVTAVGVVMLWAGSRLARTTSSGLLRSCGTGCSSPPPRVLP